MINYCKKFSIMFVMALVILFGNCISVFATDTNAYTENLIPTMTSSTNNGITASASSEYVNAWYAWYAFDRIRDTSHANGWASNGVSGWLKVDFGTNNEKKVNKYTVKCRTYNDNSAPKNWTIESSNDNLNWITLDTRINEVNWNYNLGEKREYVFENNTKYRYYRINVTDNNGQTSYTDIDEIEMMEKVQNNAISLLLDKQSMSLNVNDSKQITAITTPAGMQVTWKSSDPSVLTVDSNGKVTAIKEGQATVTAQIKDSEIKSTCTVNVTKGEEPKPPIDEPTKPTESEYIVNNARAKGDNTNNASGEVSIIFKGVAEAQLSVVKTADVDSVYVGDNFTYTIVVTNTSSKTAKAVVINDSAPNHIDFTVSGVTTTQGRIDPSSTSKNIRVNVGDIPPFETVTIKIPAIVIL